MDRSFSLLMALATLLTASAAPTLTLSSTAVAVDANTTVIHTITGLANGETVTVERFADVNQNGAIDFGEPALRSFVVKDGVRPIIGGVVNGNEPGDDDATANGAIRVDLAYPGVDVILNRQPGKYIIRVTGSSGIATAPFEISAPNFLQRVTGVLKNSADNATVSFGIVVILVGDGEPIGSVRTDATGAFTFIAPAGNYGLIPFADGFAADFQFVSIPANQTVTQNLSLTPAPVRVTGKLSDAATGGAISSVFMLAQQGDGGTISGALTDSNGNFGFNVTAGSWEIRPQSQFAAQLGYVIDEAGPIINAVSSPITQNLTARKATALLYGRVTDPSNNPVPNLRLRGRQQSPLNLETNGRTTATGDYYLGILSGAWELNTDGAATLLGYREVQQNFTITADTATKADIKLSAATAFVRGRVINGSGVGIPNVRFVGHFENSQQSSSSTDTSADGTFELPVWGGNWTFQIEEDGYISQQVNRTIVDGVDQTLNYVVPNSTGQISGSVKNSSGQGISGVFVNAYANINGSDYSSGAETDSNGNFQLPAINGAWSLSLSCDNLEQQNYDCPQNQSATINNNNATVNFVLQTFVTTALINGRVINGAGTGVSGIQVGAILRSTQTSRSSTSQNDGSFSIPVYAGAWDLYVFNLSEGLIASQVNQITVADGVNVNNVQIKLIQADATITGTVKDTAGVAISGVKIYSSATIDNFNYFAPFIVTAASGSFSLPVSRAAWNVMVDCAQLSDRQLRCPSQAIVDASSGSGTVNFVVQSESAPTQPEIESPSINLGGQIPIFRFTVRGQPGTYDIYGAVDLNSPWNQIQTTVITAGGDTATPEFNPGTYHFFRVQLRP
jgi:hypothetical protein